jgi:two-component system chemotaxis family response regulator WspR
MENELNNETIHKATVLLIDDQAMVGEAIRRMLENEDHIEFHFCEDPAKALEIAIEINATIILQDLVMPDVDGMTLLHFYKNHPNTSNIPVIILSSKDDVEIKSDAFANGANDYLVKLPDPVELIARIRAHTKHYATEMERNIAYEKMRDMQEDLAKANDELEKRNIELQRLSSVDGLTGIPNRRSFDEFIKQEWARARRKKVPTEICLLMIDIDQFKSYNDGNGHLQGDDCLKQVSWELHKGIKRDCDLLARYGGEEFVAVLPDTPLEDATQLAEQLRENVLKLALPHKFSKYGKFVSISIGVSRLLPSTKNKPEQLLEAADKALYQAKEKGRNQVITIPDKK